MQLLLPKAPYDIEGKHKSQVGLRDVQNLQNDKPVNSLLNKQKVKVKTSG